MPLPLFKAFGLLKKSYALANNRFGLENNICTAIMQACDEIIAGNLHNHSSLNICEKGSSAQINMNVNEVIANYATQNLDRTMGIESVVHPNQHVNKNQSSDVMFFIGRNRCFPLL